MLNDSTIINLSISERWQTLEMPWKDAKDKYLIPFFGNDAAKEAEKCLTESKVYIGKSEAGTIYLSVK